jgi:tetratricopeptide (TPR) repeat protein
MTSSGVLVLDGQPVAGSPASVEAWNTAWTQFVHFEGDPFATLASANALHHNSHGPAPDDQADNNFVLGPVFVAMYSVLGGVPSTTPSLRAAAYTARARLGSEPRERAFVDAMDHLVAGNFTTAATTLDTWAHDQADFAAVRIAHDIYLHVGDNQRRLASSSNAVRQWQPGAPGSSYVMGQHAFALEEVGLLAEAEQVGRTALAADQLDLWARHALAHVYETAQNSAAAFALLDDSVEVWSRQESLAMHIWWHLALRHLAEGNHGVVLDIYGQALPAASTAFRLSDLSSLLWRLELAGVSIGDRWTELADRWAATTEQHTCAFLDAHAAMAFARRPHHPAAAAWYAGVRAAAEHGDAVTVGAALAEASANAAESENATTFAAVVGSVVDALHSFGAGRYRQSADHFKHCAAALSHLGGSNAQRDVFTLTHLAAQQLAATHATGAPS